MLKRLLITGAGGGLGKVARKRLTHLAETVRLTDIVDLEPAADKEECIRCDLGDAQAVERLVEGCDGIVHLGGRSVEDKFSVIANANIHGVFHLYEAARKKGCSRIFLASSNHVIGLYTQDQRLDDKAQPKPDTLYGVSKHFAEGLAQMYHHRFGIETAIVRIGSCFPKPVNRRMLATWMSHDDFVSLVECVFAVPRLGCPIIYGVSDNDERWWDNSHVDYLGWRPKDNAAVYRDEVHANTPLPARDAPEAVYQGGLFAVEPIHQD
ncbi:NAD(P)-dependent oxidoreductase [Nitratireductor sp. ZSWI3]|uniref:NAD-dependent epimerase/dehydratase family protein n=1 Tax=Nitratireductor sp. ZSWI3 TaxID=2966359 RepID=UPI00215059CF|nr:NAD(P)-dependent oxidoreductase [Nitratireductor sp. ZSWI3]MCR4268097.1 NAD(P)-dependent oxidoreductase [Nitratireductor sp. ZSWI3]